MNRHLRLGVVLRLRELEEETARANLAAALATHRAAVRHADQAAQRLSERSAALARVQCTGGASADQLIDAARSLALADEQRSRAERAVESAANVLMDRRDRLGEASRRREAVERLRDRIVVEERKASDRREQAATSDLATTRHVWRAVIEADR